VNPAHTLAAAALLVSLVSHAAPDQYSVISTTPVGYKEIHIAGAASLGGTGRARTYLAVPLLNSAVETGKILTLEGHTLHLRPKLSDDEKDTVSRATYPDTHYLEITKGPHTGTTLDIAAADASTIRTHQDLADFLQSGDAYAIRPHTTLQQIFSASRLPLQAASTPAEADHILIPDAHSGQLAAYYYTTATPDGLPALSHLNGRLVTSSPILYPGSGFIVSRIGQADVSIISTGSVQPHAAIIPIEAGINLIASSFPVDTSLAQFFGKDGGGLQAEGEGAPPDTVGIPQGFGQVNQYALQKTAAGAVAWVSQSNGAPTAEDVKIPAGSVLIVQRHGAPFNLKQARPFDL
jgi:uncharacterized protein (TIGR02597 family)